MKNTILIFRSLIVLSIGLGILGEILDAIVPDLVPADLQSAVDEQLMPESFVILVIFVGVSIGVLLAGIAATVGLLLLKGWARPMALWVTVFAILLYPFLGPLLHSGWAYMAIETSMMLWGAALAMAYFAEIKIHFVRESS